MNLSWAQLGTAISALHRAEPPFTIPRTCWGIRAGSAPTRWLTRVHRTESETYITWTGPSPRPLDPFGLCSYAPQTFQQSPSTTISLHSQAISPCSQGRESHSLRISSGGISRPPPTGHAATTPAVQGNYRPRPPDQRNRKNAGAKPPEGVRPMSGMMGENFGRRSLSGDGRALEHAAIVTKLRVGAHHGRCPGRLGDGPGHG